MRLLHVGTTALLECENCASRRNVRSKPSAAWPATAAGRIYLTAAVRGRS